MSYSDFKKLTEPASKGLTNDIMKIMEAKDQLEFFANWVRHLCTENDRPSNFPKINSKVIVSGKQINIEDQKYNIRKTFDQLLEKENPQPIAISYCSEFLKDGDSTLYDSSQQKFIGANC